ncbi:MAG: glycosyltransferase family 4 protein [Pirellulales bacterium]|nr:glycosyltransferase family 4 protein [Pirellulales bacterium]
MRIAHVITRMILGGAQENTLLTCQGLRERYGDDVLLITGPALGPEGTLLDRAEASGLPVAIVPSLRRAIHPLRDATSYLAIRRRLREFAPEVVHTHSAKGGILGRAAAHALAVPAIVHTVHGAPFYEYQSAVTRQFYIACERWAARRCHHLVSVADAMTDCMVAAGVAPRERFTTVYSGMEVKPFLEAEFHRLRVRQALGYRDEHVVVGKIARLFELKGHADVIEAARNVVARNPQVRFLFVGDGVLRTELQSQIDRAGLHEYFQFTGLVPPTRIPELIAGVDLVVHASLREGLARVLPQAMLVGRAVVSYDIDGAREVVLPDRTGILLRPRDVAGLALAIEQLAADPERRARYGAAGRELCRDRFSHDRMTDELRALYARLLAARPPLGR